MGACPHNCEVKLVCRQENSLQAESDADRRQINGNQSNLVRNFSEIINRKDDQSAVSLGSARRTGSVRAVGEQTQIALFWNVETQHYHLERNNKTTEAGTLRSTSWKLDIFVSGCPARCQDFASAAACRAGRRRRTLPSRGAGATTAAPPAPPDANSTGPVTTSRPPNSR